MKKKKKEGLNKKVLRGLIYDIFSNNPHKPFNYKQVSKRITLTKPADRQLVVIALDEMAEQGIIKEIERGKYLFNITQGQYSGIIDIKPNGAALVIAEETGEEIFVTQRNMNHALNGDLVRLYVYRDSKKNMLEGEVVEIIRRSHNLLTGTAELSHGFAFIIPDGKALQSDIFIPPDKLKGVKNGQKVTVRITDWPARSKNPIGEIVEILGWAGDHKAEMHAIMAEFDLPSEFPDEVEREAREISEEIPASEIRKRRDFRNVLTFTIDPEDAKDFDDAISLQIMDDGNFEIGVHIADVTHYVQPGTLLEKEAQHRATSVYLVDRVIPMLPERLSNQLCSLRPNEDKLCFSAVFEITPKAEIKSEWFGKTIIRSARRFSYEEAQERLETGKGDYAEELALINGIARRLRQNRFKKGAIGFEKIELKFQLDENGKPLRVVFKESKEAHQLIEEFMLLANKQVAEYVGKAKKDQPARTFVYRIHDRPDEHKLADFAGFIRQFGYRIETQGNKAIATSINKLIETLKGKPEKEMIENLAIRSMAKAEYSTRNIGHYGLAFNYYSHFTSPIRRYPDMMAHRLLWHYLNKGKTVKQDEYEPLCRHSSEMEQRAAEAERASVKYKQAEFMSGKTGIPFDGIISGVTEWGIFVMITENRCEGLVPLRRLEDDFYVYDSKKMQIRGRHSGNTYRLGDKVKVVIEKVNLSKRQIDMQLYENNL